MSFYGEKPRWSCARDTSMLTAQLESAASFKSLCVFFLLGSGGTLGCCCLQEAVLIYEGTAGGYNLNSRRDGAHQSTDEKRAVAVPMRRSACLRGGGPHQVLLS